MRFLGLIIINTVISAVAGFIGALPGTVVLMWLVALIHQHVFAGVQPAGYGDLFLIDWILSYMSCGLALGIKTLLED